MKIVNRTKYTTASLRRIFKAAERDWATSGRTLPDRTVAVEDGRWRVEPFRIVVDDSPRCAICRWTCLVLGRGQPTHAALARWVKGAPVPTLKTPRKPRAPKPKPSAAERAATKAQWALRHARQQVSTWKRRLTIATNRLSEWEKFERKAQAKYDLAHAALLDFKRGVLIETKAQRAAKKAAATRAQRAAERAERARSYERPKRAIVLGE